MLTREVRGNLKLKDLSMLHCKSRFMTKINLSLSFNIKSNSWKRTCTGQTSLRLKLKAISRKRTKP